MSEAYEQIRQAMDIAIGTCKEMNRYPSCYVMTRGTLHSIQDYIKKDGLFGPDSCNYPSNLYGIEIKVFSCVDECLKHMATRTDTYRPCLVYTENDIKEISSHPWFFDYMMNLLGDIAPINKHVMFEFTSDGKLVAFPKKASGNQEVIYGKHFRAEDLK